MTVDECGDGQPALSERSNRTGLARPGRAQARLLCASTAARRDLLWRWLKFNFVGGVGIGVQLVALLIFRSLLHLDYLVATALAVETAVIHNFFWHERFTWADRVHIAWGASLLRLARFNFTTGAVSIFGNLLFMRWLAGELHIPYLVANCVSVALRSLANFLVAEIFVFRRDPAPDLR